MTPGRWLALIVLLGPDSDHPEWKLVHVARLGTDRETMVYQLQK